MLPGLIDMHVHIFNDDDKMRARLEQNNRDIEDNLLIGVDNARRTLEAGFTTVRDLGSDVRSVTALRDGINNGLVAGPTIYAAGTSHLHFVRTWRPLEQYESRTSPRSCTSRPSMFATARTTAVAPCAGRSHKGRM